MPKRTRSEEEEGSFFSGGRLVKNHISEREVGQGIRGADRMRSIYEKTLALLFRGSRNVANNNAAAQEENVIPKRDRLTYRQLCLSASGSVIAPPAGAGLNTSCCSCLNHSCLPSGRQCSVCSGSVGLSCVRSCDSCARASCSNCDAVRPCDRCGQSVCGSCARSAPTGGCICLGCIS